jgi:hypothetical protein
MWKSSAIAVVSLGLGLGALVPAFAADAAAQAPVTTEPAVWTQKEVQFTYMGFTTHYTCDGLRDAVREMLLQLGARKDDLKVYEQPCSRPDRPDPFPGVKIKMSVLQPATERSARESQAGAGTPGASGADSPLVEAYWKPIKLPYRATGLDAAGQCELLEQFKHTVLPLFTTRNVNLQATCVPHQLDSAGTSLQAEVLVTDQKKAPARVSQRSEGTPPADR